MIERCLGAMRFGGYRLPSEPGNHRLRISGGMVPRAPSGWAAEATARLNTRRAEQATDYANAATCSFFTHRRSSPSSPVLWS